MRFEGRMMDGWHLGWFAWGRFVAWTIRLWILVKNNLTASSPQKIRLAVYKKKMDSRLGALIDTVKKDISAAPTATSRADRRQSHPELRRKADRYWYLAEVFWGRPSDRDRFTSAWLYVLAGECYTPLDPVIAGQLFHWAAHAFRGLHSYERAIEFYEKAGRLLSEKDTDLSLRSYTRAVSVCDLIGDKAAAAGVQALIEKHRCGAEGGRESDEVPGEDTTEE